MKKILVLQWDSFADKFIQKAWENAGYEVECLAFPWKNLQDQEKAIYAEKIVKRLLAKDIDFVFSINYFPLIAITCKACQIKYVSWTYDSPFARVYSDTIFFETNYIFIFDSHTCLKLREMGANQVYYLPMAADCEYYDSIHCSSKESQVFNTDIAFVGSMYTEKGTGLVAYLDKLKAYEKGYLDAIMLAQKNIYGHYFLEEILTPAVMEEVLKVCPLSLTADSLETLEWRFAHYFLDRKITAMERLDIMKALEQSHQVKLYTPAPTPEIPKILNMGTVEYYQDAPKVFKNAKINLNITLKSILTGVPLRCFDIMGCGGFLMTNYQADMFELFEPDQDFVYYESQEDLVEKVNYYLDHEAERKEIAHNGYIKVKQYHTYEHRIASILQCMEENIKDRG